MDPLIELLKDHTVVGLITAVFGGIGVRWLDRTLRQNTDHFSQAKQIRTELRDDNTSLHDQLKIANDCIDELENDLDVWKDKYYREVEERIRLTASTSDVSIEDLNVDFPDHPSETE